MTETGGRTNGMWKGGRTQRRVCGRWWRAEPGSVWCFSARVWRGWRERRPEGAMNHTDFGKGGSAGLVPEDTETEERTEEPTECAAGGRGRKARGDRFHNRRAFMTHRL